MKVPFELVSIDGVVVGRFEARDKAFAESICRLRVRRGELEPGTGCRQSGEKYFFWVHEE